MKKIITFLFILSLSYSNICFSQSGWFWQNPLPTGNDMEKIRFVNDSVGYGVGWGSTVIKTTNGGFNWFLTNNGIKQLIGFPGYWNGILTSCYFLNEETGYIAGTNILKTTNGGINWNLLNAPLEYPYYELFFRDANTGFAESGGLIKTIDGGNTWFTVSLNGYTSFCMSFASSDTGYLGCASGIILKTVNGGINWSIINTGLTGNFLSMFFLNPSLGFSLVTGASSSVSVFKTINGGLNWTSMNFTTTSSFYSLAFVNEVTGFVSTSDGKVHRTTNGGINWQYTNVGGLLINIYFKNISIGFVVGTGGQIFRTLDQGNNWQCISSIYGSLPPLKSILFTSINTGYISATNGVVLKTINQGNNWNIINTTSNYNLGNFSFLNDEIGFVTNQVNILRTTNGGATWDSISLGAYSYPNDVYFNDFLTGYVAGRGIYKTTNGGLNWLKQYEGLNFHSINFIDTNTIYVAYSEPTPYSKYTNVFKTTNGGINWIGLNYLSNHYFERMKFVTVQIAYAIEDDKVMKSTNSGLNWFQVLDKGGYTLFFFNEDIGYIPGFKTTNGGINWFEQETLIMGNSLLSGMYFKNIDTGFMVGGHGGSILKTTDGGGPPVAIQPLLNQNPSSFSLFQNYPNPFNPVTKIKYDIPPSKGAREMLTKLIIYDILGREIETLVNESQKPGSYEVTWDGSRYASGVYFYRLYVDDASAPLSITKKMVLIK